jgi:hypothetical protein
VTNLLSWTLDRSRNSGIKTESSEEPDRCEPTTRS